MKTMAVCVQRHGAAQSPPRSSSSPEPRRPPAAHPSHTCSAICSHGFLLSGAVQATRAQGDLPASSPLLCAAAAKAAVVAGEKQVAASGTRAAGPGSRRTGVSSSLPRPSTLEPPSTPRATASTSPLPTLISFPGAAPPRRSVRAVVFLARAAQPHRSVCAVVFLPPGAAQPRRSVRAVIFLPRQQPQNRPADCSAPAVRLICDSAPLPSASAGAAFYRMPPSLAC